MGTIVVDNYSIVVSIDEVLKKLQSQLNNNKLRKFTFTSSGYRVPCPFHSDGQESHESCYINDDGIFHCFTCNEGGQLYHFIAGCFNESDYFGKKWLLSNFQSNLQELQIFNTDFLNDINTVKKKVESKILDKNILNKFQSYHPYMKTRKLSRDICEKFKIKYDSESESLVFPVWNLNNDLIMLTRRSVNSKKFNIDKDVNKTLYLLNVLMSNNITYTIVTEAQIDALTSWTYGIPAVATFGGISKSQIDMLNKSNIKFFFTIFDNDDAGRRFTKTFNDNIRKDVFVYNIDLSSTHKKDINELTKEEFISLIEKQTNMNYEFLQINVDKLIIDN